mgnify:CR=1 FL=1
MALKVEKRRGRPRKEREEKIRGFKKSELIDILNEAIKKNWISKSALVHDKKIKIKYESKMRVYKYFAKKYDVNERTIRRLFDYLNKHTEKLELLIKHLTEEPLKARLEDYEIIQKFIEEHRRHVKEKGVRQALNVLRMMYKVIRKAPHNWTLEDFEKFRKWYMQKRGFTDWMDCRMYRLVGALRAFVTRGLGREDWLKTSALAQPPKCPPGEFMLSLDEVKEIEKRLNNLEYLQSIDKKINEDIQKELLVIYLAKIFTGIRTGDRKTRKELFGTIVVKDIEKFYAKHKNTDKMSYIIFKDGEIKRWHVYAKWDTLWEIVVMPKKLVDLLTYICERRADGDYLISKEARKLAPKVMKRIYQDLGVVYEYGYKKPLHALRKVYIQLLVLSGIPLQDAVSVNVGWKDVNTAWHSYAKFGYVGKLEYFARLGEAVIGSKGVTINVDALQKQIEYLKKVIKKSSED